MKPPILIFNWKLNGNKFIIKEYIKYINNKIFDINKYLLIILPPTIYLYLFKKYLKNNFIKVGAQNIDINLSGNFTGQTSLLMLKDIKVKYVLIGHSEVKTYFNEKIEIISNKFNLIKSLNLIPIICIGENYIEYKSNKSEIVCINQINSILLKYGIKIFKKSIIAYEPIWAISSIKSADYNYAQYMANYIRNYLSQYDKVISKEIYIQYGGSVNINNINKFLSQPDIDGVLIGSSSLDIKTLKKLLSII